MVACPVYNLHDSEKWYWTQLCLVQYYLSSSRKLYIELITVQYLFNTNLGNIILVWLLKMMITWLCKPIVIWNGSYRMIGWLRGRQWWSHDMYAYCYLSMTMRHATSEARIATSLIATSASVNLQCKKSNLNVKQWSKFFNHRQSWFIPQRLQ